MTPDSRQRRFAAEEIEGVTVVTFLRQRYLAELDQTLIQQLLDELIDSGRRKIVLDLEGVEDWNSPGFESRFLAAHRRLGGLGGRLVLCSLQPMKREMFALMGWDRFLSFYSDKAEACQALLSSGDAAGGAS